MIEIGGRRVTAEELLALPVIARDAGLGGLKLGDLVGDVDAMVLLSPLAGLRSDELEGALRGGRVDLLRVGADRAPDTREAREIRKLWSRLLPGRTQSESEVFRVAIESHGDAETKAARALGVSPVAVAMAAQWCWHQSLTMQRDAVAMRMFVVPSAPDNRFRVLIPARMLQARRGHITRQLLDELRPFLKGIATKKKSRRRTP